MTGRRNWTAILAWGILLLLAGAALAIWALTRWDAGARFLGVAPAPPPAALQLQPQRPAAALPVASDPADAARIAQLEQRLARVEMAAQRTEGSVGRADALLVAFASRRAIDRGVPLGYLEPLLTERFGGSNPRAVAAIITASRDPVTLDQLSTSFAGLEKELRRGAPDESLWDGVRRELGSLVAIRRASTPSPKADARYDRARLLLAEAKVDRALAEVLRLPGAARAQGWIADARRYVIAHNALDEIESAALLSGGR